MFKLLKNLYSGFWTPVFGRLLTPFIKLIEGKEAEFKPTYDIDKSTTTINFTNNNDQ